MKMHSRPAFHFVLALTGVVTASAARFKHPIGLQPDRLRDPFQQDAPGTLDKARAPGSQHAEPAGTDGQRRKTSPPNSRPDA